MPRPIAALALSLALAAPALPAAAQEQSLPVRPDMSETERAQFRAEVRAYLLENPEVLLEAIEILEVRRAADRENVDAELVAQNRDALFNDPNAWVGGNPEGDVTLVEFFDYRCGFCKRAHPEVRALLEQDPNIRYIAKEFPILGPDSLAAARLALAALDLDPSKYGELNDALMSFEGQLTEAAAYRIAEDLGYDAAALRERAARSEIEARIRDNYLLAQALEISGTPGFVLGDRIIRGYLPLDELAAQVAEVRAATN
ncbi:MAG TPA: DsbA family protein [Thermohalobaculum sp.]|nr:DsbA family protein [Thermohalobaculum sp.]